MKREWQDFINQCIYSQGIHRFEGAHFHYVLVEPGSRRDPSNCLSGATKLIEDALQTAGCIVDDRASVVWSITGQHVVDGSPGVGVVMSDEPVGLVEAREVCFEQRSGVVFTQGMELLAKKLAIFEAKTKAKAAKYRKKRAKTREKGLDGGRRYRTRERNPLDVSY